MHLKKYNQLEFTSDNPEPNNVDVKQFGCAEQHHESNMKQSLHAEQHVKQSIHAEQHVEQSIHAEQHGVNVKQSIGIDRNHSGHMETSNYETQAVSDEKLSVQW